MHSQGSGPCFSQVQILTTESWLKKSKSKSDQITEEHSQTIEDEMNWISLYYDEIYFQEEWMFKHPELKVVSYTYVPYV